MIPVMRFCALALIAAPVMTPVLAADLVTSVEPTSPSAPPSFYVHVGALGGFPEINAQPTGGGQFGIANVAIRPVYTLDLEVRLFHHPRYRDRILDFGAADRAFQGDRVPSGRPLWHQPFGQHARRVCRLSPSIPRYPVRCPSALCRHWRRLCANFGNISDGILIEF